MKNLTLKAALYSAAAFALSVAPGFAQQTGHVTVKVPFDFAAGSKMMPAGDYDFQNQPNGVVLISSPSQHTCVLVLTNPQDLTDISARPSVKFDKTGEQYSLTEIDMAGEPGHRLLNISREAGATTLGSIVK